MSWLHTGGTLLLHHPLDLPTFFRQIATERPQYAIAPPAVLNMLLKNEALLASVDLSSLRCIGSGSAPLAPEMIQGYQDRFGIEICNNFGSNEGVSLISNATNAADALHRARWFPRYGRDEVSWTPPPPVQIRTRLIDPENGSEILTAGHAGELQITGPTVFDGYLNAPQINAESFASDGWFRTGDMFELCGDGDELRFYRFVGRLRQVINRGGMKISPEELDNALRTESGFCKGEQLLNVGVEFTQVRLRSSVPGPAGLRRLVEKLTEVRLKGLHSDDQPIETGRRSSKRQLHRSVHVCSIS